MQKKQFLMGMLGKAMVITALVFGLIFTGLVLTGCPTGNEQKEQEQQGPVYDANGFDADGNHRDTGTKYNPAGYDKGGYDVNGYNAAGYDKFGYDVNGYDVDGYNSSGVNAAGKRKDTVYVNLTVVPAAGSFEDGSWNIDAEINAAKAQLGGVKTVIDLTLPSGQTYAVSFANVDVPVNGGVRNGVFDIASAEQAAGITGWVNPANGVSLSFTVPEASTITARNSAADSANKQATLFIVKAGVVPSRVKSDGSAVKFKLDKSIVAIFKDVTIADNDAAAARLDALNIILADNQTNHSFQPLNRYPLMWVNNTDDDIDKIRTVMVGNANFTTRLLLPDSRYLETDGIVTGTETAMLNRQSQYQEVIHLANGKKSLGSAGVPDTTS
ncbi:hypothetical protein FACS1894109_20910 [Spirochaetia bacterium]|nr:hypothetical protein FACS1894109_20910 [Spirochaetia bacterium]